MVNTLSVASIGSSFTSSTAYALTLQDTQIVKFTTELSCECIYELTGNLSNLWMNIPTNGVGNTTTVVIRKNLVNANQTISVGANATGTFTDASHTDSVSAGDVITCRATASSTGTILITVISLTFNATINTVKRIGRTANFNYTSTATYYSTIAGLGNSAITSEAAAKNRQRKAGTYKNAMIVVITNTDNTNDTWISRKNGVNGNISISITANTTGNFEDKSHSDSVVTGDDYNYAFVYTQAATMNIGGANIDFVSINGDGIISAADHTQATITTLNTNYYALGGAIASPRTTESDMQTKVNSIYTFSELTINVQTNGITNASTITLRVGGASAGVSASIGGSATGVFSDSVNTYVSAATDLMNYQLVTGSTGTSIKISHISVWTNGNPINPVTPTGFPQNFRCLPERPGAPKTHAFGNLAPNFGI